MERTAPDSDSRIKSVTTMEVANVVEAKLNDEFDDFTTSLKNRLAEEFRK